LFDPFRVLVPRSLKSEKYDSAFVEVNLLVTGYPELETNDSVGADNIGPLRMAHIQRELRDSGKCECK
jgi:hypothetical protein